MNQSTLKRRLLEVFAVFAKLGTISFGGPAAHIALMERELVQRRAWLDHQTFLDLNSLSQLIPGPNSTELAIHIGYKRAGWLGLIVAGASFILPAMLIVGVLAWIYQTYAALPVMQHVMYGIKPVIVAIIAHAVWLLGKSAIKNRTLAVITCVAFLAIWLGVSELLAIGAAGLVYWLLHKARTSPTLSILGPLPLLLLIKTDTTSAGSLSQMFWTFLKIGAVLYGSGYVLVAYLQTEFVDRLGVLTQQQLIDAVAIGQFTPGPLFTTATFIGYLLHGSLGAALATMAIFLPAFVFVAAIVPWTQKLRSNKTLSLILDGVNCASLAFMAVVAVMLAQPLFMQPFQLLVLAISLVLLLRFQWNSAWFVLAGALLGGLWAVVQ